MVVSKEHLIPVKTPNGEISKQWLLEELQKCFIAELNEHYDVEGIDEETANVSLQEEDISPNTNLAMLVGLDKDKGRMEAQFLFSTSCFAAGVKAGVRKN